MPSLKSNRKGESVGPKHYKWDKEDGYWVPSCRVCYNSYFFPVEDESYDLVQKMYLHGSKFTGCLDGGSACHLNQDYPMSKAQYRKMMDIAINAGCGYLTFNCPQTICNDCGRILKYKSDECPDCHSHNLDYATRIIGYLKRVSNFSEIRQKEAKMRYFEDAPKED